MGVYLKPFIAFINIAPASWQRDWEGKDRALCYGSQRVLAGLSGFREECTRGTFNMGYSDKQSLAARILRT